MIESERRAREAEKFRDERHEAERSGLDSVRGASDCEHRLP